MDERTKLARLIRRQRNMNVLHGGLVSCHGSLRNALIVRNADAVVAARGAIRADRKFGIR